VTYENEDQGQGGSGGSEATRSKRGGRNGRGFGRGVYGPQDRS
jgi:hypothetical protein